MTPIDEIGRAATLMRERAQAATPGPWEALRRDTYPSVDAANGHLVMETVACDEETHGDRAIPDAEHIASWHPAVALAIADWLDHMAMWCEQREQARIGAYGINGDQDALAIARAYLGSASSKSETL